MLHGNSKTDKEQTYLILWLTIWGFRKSQSTPSFFGGVLAAHGLMIVLY